MFTDRRANSSVVRRVKQPWPTGKPFKILSLDGGGIKGFYSAELIRLCEEKFCLNSSMARYFDMIAGTSTGGIMALGLGLEMPADEIVSFYRDDGRVIFPPLPSLRVGQCTRFISSLFRPKLEHQRLEHALRTRFGNRLLGESVTRLVVPAFMMPKTEIAVFKTDHHADFRKDHATPIWKVARSTSAAPTYLKGLEHSESGKIFIDGGVWANNPVMVAIIDALSAYDIEPDQIKVFSIGTGNPPFQLKQAQIFGGLFSWKEAIKAAMFLTTDNANAQAKLLLGPSNCLRLEPIGKNAGIEMDDYDEAFACLPTLAVHDFAQYVGLIEPFFTEKVTPRDRFYS